MRFHFACILIDPRKVVPDMTVVDSGNVVHDSNRQLQDFSVGFWDAYDGDRKIAEVLLEKVLDGHAIHEVWTPADPAQKGHGRGIFTYSPVLKAWHYLWVSDRGSTTYFTSEPTVEGEILYVTSLLTPTGMLRSRRWTLTAQPDGGVRELCIASEDGGATWTTEYDLYWIRK